MNDTLTRYLASINDDRLSRALRVPLTHLIDRYSTQPLTSAGLAISGAGAATAKIGGAAFYAVVKGRLVTLAAGTVMPALTGVNVPAGQFNVACFFMDGAGNVVVAGGTPAPVLGNVGWPRMPNSQALIGFLIITGAGAFVGGTTALDAGTTVYVSPLGPFDPTALI